MARAGTNHKGGRPKGKRNQKTILKEKVTEAFNQRVYSIVDSLLSSQQSLAKGQQFLYKIETKHSKGPKGGDVKTKQKPVLVTSQWEIEEYLDSLESDNPPDPDVYYYITTKEPSNMAIDSLMNRALGKPVESVRLSDGDGKPLQPTVIFIPKPFESNE